MSNIPFRELYDRLLLGEKILLPIPDPKDASRLRSLLSTLHSRQTKIMADLGTPLGLSLLFGKVPGKSVVYEIQLGEKQKQQKLWKIISEDELAQYE